MTYDTIDPAYSAALDEIFRLRCVLAYEARIIEAHLDLATFPKSRRPIAEDQVGRMRAAAGGAAVETYRNLDWWKLKAQLLEATGNDMLTRRQWEQEVAAR